VAMVVEEKDSMCIEEPSALMDISNGIGSIIGYGHGHGQGMMQESGMGSGDGQGSGSVSCIGTGLGLGRGNGRGLNDGTLEQMSW
jgi:hypothetical protein